MNKRYKYLQGEVVSWDLAKRSGRVRPRDRSVLVHVYADQIVRPKGEVVKAGDKVTFRIRKKSGGRRHENKYAPAPRAASPKQDVPEAEAAHPEGDTDQSPLRNANDFVALALVGSAIRLVSLSSDGTYQFLDSQHNFHNIWYVASPEALLLQSAIEELEWLVNEPRTREMDLQRFFEKYPTLILNDEYQKAHAHVILQKDDGRILIPDFVLEPIEQSRLCDLLELKRPDASVFVLKKRRPRFAADVLEACAQLREYSAFFEEERNRRRIQDQYGLLAYKPRMLVLIGRRGGVDPLTLRSIETDLPNLVIRTYDEVIARAKARLDAMRSPPGSSTSGRL